VRSSPGLLACQAIYAFFGGQNHDPFDPDLMFDGLLGGYQAYGYYSCTWLQSPRFLEERNIMLVAICNLSIQQGLKKLFYVDVDTGAIYLQCHEPLRAINNNQSPKPDEFLMWLEEYGQRLESGKITAGTMGCHPSDPSAITLYPRVPPGAPPTTITEGVPDVSRAVTRGVEVIASGVYVPQCRNRFGFIYSIRIRLLTPDDDGYVSPADRGFETCQLQSRHWHITDYDTGEIDRVDGEGVIGMYPILSEGGYIEDGEECSGSFQYQSCCGVMQGSFQGQMQFVPGTITSSTGRPFNVELQPFALDTRPSYLY
jgi:uncharacterized protein affecting Mg2+/Co2+ transport